MIDWSIDAAQLFHMLILIKNFIILCSTNSSKTNSNCTIQVQLETQKFFKCSKVNFFIRLLSSKLFPFWQWKSVFQLQWDNTVQHKHTHKEEERGRQRHAHDWRQVLLIYVFRANLFLSFFFAFFGSERGQRQSERERRGRGGIWLLRGGTFASIHDLRLYFAAFFALCRAVATQCCPTLQWKERG